MENLQESTQALCPSLTPWNTRFLLCSERIVLAFAVRVVLVPQNMVLLYIKRQQLCLRKKIRNQ